MSRPRPKIEVVRLPSNERAKIQLDGVQLYAEYQHYRLGSYIAAISNAYSLDSDYGTQQQQQQQHRQTEKDDDSDESESEITGTKYSCYQFRKSRKPGTSRQRTCPSYPHLVKSLENVAGIIRGSRGSSSKTTEPHSTKSCDNLFSDAQKKVRPSPFTWKSTTRSEEHLPKSGFGSLLSREHVAKSSTCSSVMAEPEVSRNGVGSNMTSRSVPSSPCGSKVIQKSSTMPHQRMTGAQQKPSRKFKGSSLASFLKKLSPRLRRSPPKGSERPWIVVEFSRQDIDGSDGTSDASDRSFEMAVKHRRELKMAAAGGKAAESTSGDKGQFLFSKLSPKKVLHSIRKGSIEKEVESDTSEAELAACAGRQQKPQYVSVATEHVTPHIFIRPPEPYRKATSSPSGTSTRLTTRDVSPMREQISRSGKFISRPHSLNIRNKIVVRSPHAEKVASKMASCESIGSCSLDVDITASESPAAATGSQNTLVSVSIENHSDRAQDRIQDPECSLFAHSLDQPCLQVPQGRRTIRFQEEHSESNLSFPRSRNTCLNGAVLDSGIESRKPSYLNLSCSISGYTSITQYNSKLREELRSRDNSPARFAFAYEKSGGSGSPTTHGQLLSPSKIRELKEKLVAAAKQCASDAPDDTMERKVAVNGSRDELDKSPRHLIQHSQRAYFQESLSHTHSLTFEQSSHSISFTEVLSLDKHTDEPSPGKSFIQQRIERLYGPGALAQGFYKSSPLREGRNSRNSSMSSIDTPIAAVAEPPVFRHLRPEFRVQLPLKNSPLQDSPHRRRMEGMVEGAKRGIEHNIPIQLLGFEKEETEESVHSELGSTGSTGQDAEQGMEVKDGHYYLKVLEKERARIGKMVTETEKDLNERDLPEEASGKLRAAVGKARLLLVQKMEQFAGLCQKNIRARDDDPFPTTAEDLAGFWDMVSIQVEDINNNFLEIDRLRKNNWQEVIPVKRDEGQAVKKRPCPRRHPKTAALTPTNKARDEARRKLMEDRRQAMRALKEGAGKSSDASVKEVEIFVPERK